MMRLLEGLPIARTIREEILRGVALVEDRGIHPKLAVILAGNDPGSVWYAENKAALGAKLGIAVEIARFPPDVPERELLTTIAALNDDRTVHGVLVELPLPPHADKTKVLNAIDPGKDVDGVTAVNRGYLLSGREDLALVPATPSACLEILARSGYGLSGKRVTLVGRGDTVGRPLLALLVKRDATVTVCHTRTADLAAECRHAEILIVAAGVAGLIGRKMVAPGAVVVDAGINEIEPGKFVGDVDFDAVKEIASAVTPVPGGVGTLTTTMIMTNILKALRRQYSIEE